MRALDDTLFVLHFHTRPDRFQNLLHIQIKQYIIYEYVYRYNIYMSYDASEQPTSFTYLFFAISLYKCYFYCFRLL